MSNKKSEKIFKRKNMNEIGLWIESGSKNIRGKSKNKRNQMSNKGKKYPHEDPNDADGILKPDKLLHFLEKMRKMVAKRKLDFSLLKLIVDKLIEEKLETEVLLLMDLIIRFQVGELKDLIFTDLLSIEILPENFVKAFLKQYILLKRISLAYSNIMEEFEQSFLCPKDLKFDLICRAHFKVHLYDSCNEIQDLIDAGHLDVKEELILDIEVDCPTPESIKDYYSQMKSDFKCSSKWKDVQKNVENILNDPYETSRTLLKYFNYNLSNLLPSLPKKTREYCQHHKPKCNHNKTPSPNTKSLIRSSAASSSSNHQQAHQHDHFCPNHPNHALHCQTRHKQQNNNHIYHHCHHHNPHTHVNHNLTNTTKNINSKPIMLSQTTSKSIKSTPQKLTSNTAANATKKAASLKSTSNPVKPPVLATTSNLNSSSIYQDLAKVKPPSLSSTTSSTTNDYSSCASKCSSASSDENDNNNNNAANVKFAAFLQKQNTANKKNTKTKSSKKYTITTITSSDIDGCSETNSGASSGTNNNNSNQQIATKLQTQSLALGFKTSTNNDSDFGKNDEEFNTEELIAFNKLYEAYLKDNQEFLTETTSDQKVSDEECLKKYDTATDLKSFLNVLMSKCSQNIEKHDQKKKFGSNLSLATNDNGVSSINTTPDSTMASKKGIKINGLLVDDLFVDDDSTLPGNFPPFTTSSNNINIEIEDLSRSITDCNVKRSDQNFREFERYIKRTKKTALLSSVDRILDKPCHYSKQSTKQENESNEDDDEKAARLAKQLPDLEAFVRNCQKLSQQSVQKKRNLQNSSSDDCDDDDDDDDECNEDDDDEGCDEDCEDDDTSQGERGFDTDEDDDDCEELSNNHRHRRSIYHNHDDSQPKCENCAHTELAKTKNARLKHIHGSNSNPSSNDDNNHISPCLNELGEECALGEHCASLQLQGKFNDMKGNSNDHRHHYHHSINQLNAPNNASNNSGNNNGNSNKVCKCCKCEMFGDSNGYSSSVRGGGLGDGGRHFNRKQRLRRKLEQRKEQQAVVETDKLTNHPNNNSNHNHDNNCVGNNTPAPNPKITATYTSNNVANIASDSLHSVDIDSLVRFIEGADQSNETASTNQTQSNKKNNQSQASPLNTSKSKSKNKAKAKKAQQNNTNTNNGNIDKVGLIALSSNNGNNVNSISNGNYSSIKDAVIQNTAVLKNNQANNNNDNSNTNVIVKHKSADESDVKTKQEIRRDSCSSMENKKHKRSEKTKNRTVRNSENQNDESDDSVVEDFKAFCNSITSTERKKLNIDPNLFCIEK